MEGGSDISIYGANFASATLFTEAVVFIGNDRCVIDGYHTNDMRIVCRTPICRSEACRSKDIYSGETKMDIKVYVSSVEGILTTTYSSFRYLNYQTPNVWEMPSATWGTATSWVVAYARTSLLADIDVSIGADHHADLGSDDELNPDTYNYYQSEKTFNFRVSDDIVAGYYNLSLSVKDTAHENGVGTGTARLFAEDRLNNERFDRFYLFSSSLTGTPYTTCVFPAITAVNQNTGSLAGGTRLSILGAGFSYSIEELTVLVGGIACDVVSATTTSIECITKAAVSDEDAAQAAESSAPVEFSPSNSFGEVYASARSYGSPGWWFKFWDSTDMNYDVVGEDVYIATQFGWRDKFYFSMYDYFGSNWYSILGVQTSNRRFAQDAAAVLIAPYSGYYTFYVASDDTSHLYGSSESPSSPGQFGSETLLAHTNSHVPDKSYYLYPTQISAPIALRKNERYLLRFRVVNSGGYDYSAMGLKISPAFTDSGDLEDENWDAPTLENEGELSEFIAGNENKSTAEVRTANFPEGLLQHHSKRAMQIVSLSMDYYKETQLLSLRNVTGGRFQIVVQGVVATDPIDISASASTISSALYYAAAQISSSDRECLYFTVTKQENEFGVDIIVQFNVDTTAPKTLLVGIDYNLVGFSPDIIVTRTQEHSPLPYGSFSLNMPGTNKEDINIPYNSDVDDVENAIESVLGEDNYNVEVSRSGQVFSGYSWTITFATPRSEVPVLAVSSIDIYGPEKNYTYVDVVSRVNASTTELFFDHIPSWLTEVPTSWATDGKISSNVEVYRTTPEGDRLKAVCDGTGEVGSDLQFRLKGDETACAFSYTTSVTPVIFRSHILSFVDRVTTEIGINGTGFSLGANNFAGIVVSIGEQHCNVSVATDGYIVCTVSSVPWGFHTVDVFVPGVGNALSADKNLLEFKQKIYSLEVLSGSAAGGQKLNITGRGFRRNASVSLGFGECVVEFYSSSNIVCIAPPIEPKEVTFCATDVPSSLPSSYPSGNPSLSPSGSPSIVPTSRPISLPTYNPTNPSSSPTGWPTAEPTSAPSGEPSGQPTSEPTSMPSTDEVVQ